jgi:phosphoribosylformimino-5-aminoimidazole carboxamide ribotide isomerase
MAAMILYPAIDLQRGKCVRVVGGDFNTATVFNDDPAAQARIWAEAGFSWLHVVDLDGSAAGRSVNAEAVAGILEAVSIPVQLGGGVRSMADIAGWIDAGVSRVILGTAAVRDPQLVRLAAARWPERIVVSIDVRRGKVAINGWTEGTDLDAGAVAHRFEDAGVAAVIVTDIDRDGSQAGFDIEVFGALADQIAIPVIAAGGLAAVADIHRLRARKGARVAGAILGRALYAGAFAPAEALAAAEC